MTESAGALTVDACTTSGSYSVVFTQTVSNGATASYSFTLVLSDPCETAVLSLTTTNIAVTIEQS